MPAVPRPPRDADAGFTLVEVLWAMFLFALVSTGLLYGMMQVLSLTRDARAREVAVNLAAEEIDLARDAADLFALLDVDRDVALNGDTFHVERRTQWVSDPAADFSCGTGGGPLRYKRVNVEVTWDGMRGSGTPVRADTVLNPAQRINDPERGTIVVSVLGAAGTGMPGITVTTSPSTGSAIAATDAQGCAYVLKVVPGTYTIGVQRTGHISDTQLATPSQEVVVTAGATASVGFQMDRFATVNATIGTGSPRVSTAMPVTFANTYGRFAVTPASGAGSSAQTFRLHPFSSGYQAYAGGCTAADPTAWPQEVVAGVSYAGSPGTPVTTAPGGTVAAAVPVGQVRVQAFASDRHLRAVAVTPAAGLPGCAEATVYTFGDVLASPVTIALPYGTWKLYRGGASAQTTPVTGAQVTALTPAVPTRTTVQPDGTIVLDPRVEVTP